MNKDKELAEFAVEKLEGIKREIEALDKWGETYHRYNLALGDCVDIINEHIKELKGELNMADIELVIKIHEDIMEYIKNNGCLSVIYNNGVAKAVTNGTPLPKGHGRLIDADYLREDFKASKRISFAERMDISCIVDHAPTIIEADKGENK